MRKQKNNNKQKLFEMMNKLNPSSKTQLNESDTYKFKKQLKNFLAPNQLFLENVLINDDANVEIVLRKSSMLKPTQYYNVVYNYYLREVNDEINELKIIPNVSKSLVLVDNKKSELKEPPKLHYISKDRKTLDDVFDDFKKHIKIILWATNLGPQNEVSFSDFEYFMVNLFVATQEKMLGGMVMDKHEHTFTISPSNEDETYDLTFKPFLNKETYFIEGDIEVNFDSYQYNYPFNDLPSFKKIMDSVLKSF